MEKSKTLAVLVAWLLGCSISYEQDAEVDGGIARFADYGFQFEVIRFKDASYSEYLLGGGHGDKTHEFGLTRCVDGRYYDLGAPYYDLGKGYFLLHWTWGELIYRYVNSASYQGRALYRDYHPVLYNIKWDSEQGRAYTDHYTKGTYPQRPEGYYPLLDNEEENFHFELMPATCVLDTAPFMEWGVVNLCSLADAVGGDTISSLSGWVSDFLSEGERRALGAHPDHYWDACIKACMKKVRKSHGECRELYNRLEHLEERMASILSRLIAEDQSIPYDEERSILLREIQRYSKH